MKHILAKKEDAAVQGGIKINPPTTNKADAEQKATFYPQDFNIFYFLYIYF